MSVLLPFIYLHRFAPAGAYRLSTRPRRLHMSRSNTFRDENKIPSPKTTQEQQPKQQQQQQKKTKKKGIPQRSFYFDVPFPMILRISAFFVDSNEEHVRLSESEVFPFSSLYLAV